MRDRCGKQRERKKREMELKINRKWAWYELNIKRVAT